MSAWELLDTWERGLAQPALQRALTLLAAANPGTPPDALAALSIGQRDARLLTLREWAFGPQLVGLATCPECSERLELVFEVRDIRTPPPFQPSPLQAEEGEGVESLSLTYDGYQVDFRLPNSLDLAAVAGMDEVDATRQVLLERCLLTAQHDGAETNADSLPVEVIEAVVERMAQADPQADVQLDLTCPECEHRWQAAFDIVTYFWTEINAWAHRILREVHTLAYAYGWRESDILAMSPWRRAYYLELVAGA